MKPNFFLVLFVCALISGCASTPQTSSLLGNPGDLPLHYEIANVPFIPQSEYYCGPASLAMIANWDGLHISPDELAPLMFTPGKKGTFQADYLGAARRIGLLAIAVTGLKNILIEVRHDHPVVVLQNLGSSANPIWHYAVIDGYDLSNEELIFHSGNDIDLRMKLSQFERTWKGADDWALLILAPGALPQSASLQEVLVAASALERVNKNQEANITYQSVLNKSPDDVGALFGLGNTFAALKKYRQSATAFEHASKLEPGSAAIWNNLAEVYLKLKKKKLAAQAFKKSQQ